jgi:flagellar protein FliS
MTKELLQAYTARITQASKTELVVIIYEIMLIDIEEAQEAYQNKDTIAFVKAVKHAQLFLSELMGALDFKYDISRELMSLYIYVNKALITASIQKKPETLSKADSVLRKLMVGFQGICKEDISGPVMQNTQQLYAGFTYGKGVLNEVYIDPREQNRGFKA